MSVIPTVLSLSAPLSLPHQHQSRLQSKPIRRKGSIVSSFHNGDLQNHQHHVENKPIPISLNSAIANTDIIKLCRTGRLKEALDFLNIMHERAIPVEHQIYAALLQSCAKMKALTEGKHLHALIVSSNQEILFADIIINMYAKCGSLRDARTVFDRTPKGNALLWNLIILAYVNQGFYEEAFFLYYQMLLEGVKSDHYTFPCILKACAGLRALSRGGEIHAHVIRTGFESHVFVSNALVAMYGVCGSLEYARKVFDKMPQRDVVSWNAVIVGYVRDERFEEAMQLFREMQATSTKPDLATMVSVVPVCACLGDLMRGKEIHGYVVRNGLEGGVLMGNALIDMYGKCGSVSDASKVFENMTQRDVVSWTAMISCYAENHKHAEALGLFHQMVLRGVRPDAITMSSVISVCARIGDLEQGKYMHDYVNRNRIDSDFVVENALLDMYVKCNRIKSARSLFDKMSQRDVFSWSTIIAGYSQVGYRSEALNLFRHMLLTVKPNSVTIVAILPACANLPAVQRGKEIHNYIIKSELLSSDIANQLVLMYAKCGRVEDARLVFDKMAERNAELWTAMIAGYGKQDRGKEALSLFHQMRQEGIEPDDITFVAVLCACSHAGFVDEGWKYFRQMSQEYHIKPNLKHYACMVDLLGRAGFMEEVHNFIKEMPVEPDAAVWGALLGACRIHHYIDLGEQIAKHVLELEPKKAGYYILLSRVYADADRWDGVAKVRRMMKERGLLKDPGCSWIEVNNTVHAFLVGDRSHPQSDKIYAILDSWATRMKDAGYVQNTNFVLQHELEVAGKEDILCGHNEKLAIAFGLISTPPGAPLRITKNLCTCLDCHEATKFISKIVRREITVKETSKRHIFKDGMCSCGD